MNNLHSLYTFIDLAGTFAFAISGAVAARDKGMDVFGILVVAFTVACGGGIIRDVCMGPFRRPDYLTGVIWSLQ